MIDACEEIGIIKNDKTGRKIITLKEWEKDYDKYAKKLNISDKVVSKWECGESEPSVSDLINLAKIFNVSLDYLAKGTISNSDKRILEKQPTTGELADDFLDQCKKIIRDKNLNKFKDLLLPQKVIGRAKPEYGEHVT